MNDSKVTVEQTDCASEWTLKELSDFIASVAEAGAPSDAKVHVSDYRAFGLVAEWYA